MDPLVFRCPSCGGINRVKRDRLEAGPKCGRCHQPLDLSAAPIELDDDALKRLVEQSPVPVLVDFWAPWCPPCRMVAPHLVELARRHAGTLIVAKVDTDQHSRTAAELQVRSIPTLAIWKNGKLVKSQAGALLGPQLESYVAPHL
jgi:thioredoxin 2